MALFFQRSAGDERTNKIVTDTLAQRPRSTREMGSLNHLSNTHSIYSETCKVTLSLTPDAHIYAQGEYAMTE